MSGTLRAVLAALCLSLYSSACAEAGGLDGPEDSRSVVQARSGQQSSHEHCRGAHCHEEHPLPDATCPDHGGDAGASIDAGAVTDAGVEADAGADAACDLDAGAVLDGGADAGAETDAGSEADAGSDAATDAAADAGPEVDGSTPEEVIDDVVPPPADPLETPFGTPIPGQAVVESVGPAGATLMSFDGALTLTIPPGALAAPVAIGIEAVSNQAPGGLGNAYRLIPEGQTFALPVTVSFVYRDDELEDLGAGPDGLDVAIQNADGIWEAPETSVDPEAHTISAQTTHFSHAARSVQWRIRPSSSVVFTGSSLSMFVETCVTESALGLVLTTCRPIQAPLSSWAVNGSVGGNASVGTLSASGTTGLYTAPSSVSPDPLRVAVTVRVRFGARVRTLRATVLVTSRAVWGGTVTATTETSFELPENGGIVNTTIFSRSQVTFYFEPGFDPVGFSDSVVGSIDYTETRAGPECTTTITAYQRLAPADGTLFVEDDGQHNGSGELVTAQGRGVTACLGAPAGGGGILPIGVDWWPSTGFVLFPAGPDPNVLDDSQTIAIPGGETFVLWHLERRVP